MAIGIVGAPLTFLLAYRCRWGAILCSSMPTVVVAGTLFVFPHVRPDPAAARAAAWTGANFVGMTLPRVLPRARVAAPLAGAVFVGLFVYFGRYLSGFGGIVGVNALIAVFAVRGRVLLGGTTVRRGCAGTTTLDEV